ncbi:hypothetical protein ACJBS1_10760, partial [Streptococcus suis]
GLFYARIFVLTGFYLGEKLNHPILQYRQKTKLLVSTVILICESTIIYLNQGYYKKFIFSIIQLTDYLVYWTLKTDIFSQ